MSSTPNRATDDDAPIVAADVVAARRLLGGMTLVKRCLVAGAATFAVLVVLPLMQASWQRHERFTWCMQGVTAQQDRFVRGDIPAEAVVHHGRRGMIIDLPGSKSMVVDGAVVASSQRCGRPW